jgi:hypothetical protein
MFPSRTVSRRDLLRFSLVPMGGTWLTLVGRIAQAAPAASGRELRRRACILLYMDGAPSHIDTWDMKPAAPAEIRGPFGTIDTSVPGIRVCEHFPLLARQVHRLAQIRSVRHDEVSHPPALYHVLTGFKQPNSSGNPERRLLLHPHLGTVVGKLDTTGNSVPKVVECPETMALDGPPMAGQDAGFLGPAFDPLRVKIALETIAISKPELSLPAGVSPSRLARRVTLRDGLERPSRDAPRAWSALDAFQRQALEVFAEGRLDAAFDLGREPDAVHDRYGRHRHGQCVLLARRLVEAGVRFVTVNWGREPQDWADGVKGRVANNPWDTHRNHFPLLKETLMPRADQAFSALLDDLHDRGLQEDVLVVWMGEFGRTPRITKFASRDHWPGAYTVVMSGGGIPGGAVHGRTDATASGVTDDPVGPPDILATIYRIMGIDPAALVLDRLGRPYVISTGKPIETLLG